MNRTTKTHCLAATMSGALLFAGLQATPAAQPTTAALPDEAAPCAADADLMYVCGLQRPEDILLLPGGRHVIVSGFAPGAGLTFIAAATRIASRAWNGAAVSAATTAAEFPACPGTLDPALFNARGLSLRALSADRWRLLVVNHGGRESIEAFDLRFGAAGIPVLEWRGCLPMPAGQVGNSVAAFADGTVLTTVLTRPGTSIADFVQARITGVVWRWPPGASRFEAVPGTELPGNNGLEVDPDERHFYVVAFGLHAVVIFDRQQPHAIDTVVAPDFMPDNLHWSDGRLLLAGMRLDEPACGGLRTVVNGIADPMLCHRGWVVGELDLANRRIGTVAYGGPQPAFNGLSAAALVNGELWLGSFQSDRVAIVRPAGAPP
jgi:hypothetical protein